MGDITDRPKAPKQQVVYVAKYVYTQAPSNGNTANTNDPDENGAAFDTY